MDDYRMLAEHLGKDERIRVVISGTEAKTDGTTIYLPEDVPLEVQNVLLATLLHESYQIRFTDKRDEYAATNGEEHRHNLLNVLEDIRLDAIVMKDWPNAGNLYLGLVSYYDEKHAAALAALPWQVQVLQRMVHNSYGVSFGNYKVAAEEAELWLNTNAAFAADITKRAQDAATTPDLYPLIDELLAKLFPPEPDAEQKMKDAEDAVEKAEQEAKDKADERRDAQNAAKKEFEEAKDLDAQARDLEKEAAREKGQAKAKKDEAKEKKAKAKEKKEAAKAKKEEAAEKREAAKEKKAEAKEKRKAGDKDGADADDAEADEDEVQAGAAEAEAEDMENDAEGLEGEGEAAEAEGKKQGEQAKIDEAKAEKLNEQAAPKYENLEKLQKNYEDAKKEQAEAQAKAAAGHAEKKELKSAQAKAAKAGLAGLAEVGIGFEKIAAEDLKVTKMIPENVQDEVLHFLRCREERRINAAEGRIDSRKLATFYNPDTLFTQDLQDGHYKTRVHFLVDISGSMSDRLSNDEIPKWKMAGQAVTNIAEAIERGIAMDGLEIEYGVFGFDTEAHEIKSFEGKYDANAIMKQLSPRGGTDPVSVIEDVEAKHQPDNCRTKQVVFMITDGQFGEDAYKCLEQRLGGAIKWIFLGLDVSTEDKKSRDVFGKYNIVAAKDMKKALGRALIDNLD